MDENKYEQIIEEGREIFLHEKKSDFIKNMKILLRISKVGAKEDIVEIKRFFHTIKGTGGMLRFERLSMLGKEFEEIVSDAEKENLSNEVLGKILRGFAEVYEEIENLSNIHCKNIPQK
jgi:chemotaxis protein histidine kinase CheA